MNEENISGRDSSGAGDTDSGVPNGGDWKSALPEPLRDAPWIGKADSLEAAVGQLRDAAQYMGNAIRIPSEDAGESDVAAFQQKLLDKVPGLMPVPKSDDIDATRNALRALGMPEKPEQYDVTGIDHAPDGEDLGRLRALAHEAGMTSAQFRKWISEQSSANYSAQEQVDHARNEELKELRGEWGFAFDDKVQNAYKAAEATGAPDYILDMLKNRWLKLDGGKIICQDLVELEKQVAYYRKKAAMERKKEKAQAV